MSSRLFINVREKEGLGYYIRSSIEGYKKCGYLAVKAGIDNKRIKKAITLILKELRKIRDEAVTDDELTKAKEYFKGKLALALETTDEVAFWIGAQQMVLDKIKTINELIAEVEKVTKEDIKAVAEEVIANDRLNLAVIGPYESGKMFEEMLEI